MRARIKNTALARLYRYPFGYDMKDGYLFTQRVPEIGPPVFRSPYKYSQGNQQSLMNKPTIVQ